MSSFLNKELPWEYFIFFVEARGLHIQWFETDDTYYCAAGDEWFRVTCSFQKTAPEAAEFEASYKIIKSIKPREVVTQFEKDDKVLKLASATASFVDNVAQVKFRVPGASGTIGRYIAGGYAKTDRYGWNDRITEVKIVDSDFVYAGVSGFYPATPEAAGIPGTEGLSWGDIMPDGLTLETYHDDDVAEENKGWRFYAGAYLGDGNEGECEVEPIGGFGKIPAQTDLIVTVEKESSSPASKMALDLWWAEGE
jgi:hypothetical protein